MLTGGKSDGKSAAIHQVVLTDTAGLRRDVADDVERQARMLRSISKYINQTFI